MRILMGTYSLSACYYDAYYKRAQQVNVNLAGLPALVLPCGFVEGESVSLSVGFQMIGAAFDECISATLIPMVFTRGFEMHKFKFQTSRLVSPDIGMPQHLISRLCMNDKLLKFGHIFEQTLRGCNFVPPLVADDFPC
ncbi:Glutamyl-tRNA(Gln) amidotransferase subunit A like [Actinidia chinensis var. chinensis]|uniref:Glutamyl-tRNA(Gln) amidotransferase subunit A like n=1 Tax=Actinidia chinensis var. chinensis TaxID=1590841 RepID=A0A2R6QX83_ACTCC|nr:Glutamyl-tRNA(Gln) amidotransferase subunit A like [Actinidia chinensis var. chinensis]